MSDHPGLFIVLEGADGSGKTTQFSLLTERLKAMGHEVATFDFPQYSEPSSYFVKKYLNGEYGEATSLSPYTASMFYALDRYEASSKISEALKTGKIVIANRYVGSNMAHQGSKFSSESEQRGFFVWAESLEFQLLGIPRPTINIYLRVPPLISYELIAKKAKRDYTDKKRDGHEGNLLHLEKTAATYDLLTKLFPKDFTEIECAFDNQILGIAEISDLIWAEVSPMLPLNPPNPAKSITIKLNNQKYLENPTKKAEETSKHFLVKEVKQVPEQKLEVEEISLLSSTVLLESNDNNFLEASKWHKAQTFRGCSYFIPSELPSSLSTEYLSTIDSIAKHYISMKQQVKSSPASKISTREQTELLLALQNVIPLCGFCTINLKSDQEALTKAKRALSSAPLKLSEINAIINRLDSKINDKNVDQENLDEPDMNPPLKLDEIIKQLADTRLPQNFSDDSFLPKLTSYSPHNEFDLLIRSLLVENNLPRDKIDEKLDVWSYKQKSQELYTIIAKRPTSLMSEVIYYWEYITDLSTINYLIANSLISEIKNQSITLRYGYEAPKIIEKFGLSDQYAQCFELSKALFSKLQMANLENLSAYACLMGHRSRWQFKTTALQLVDYVNLPNHNNQFLETTINSMIDSISQAHPILSKVALIRRDKLIHQEKKSTEPNHDTKS